MKFIVAVLFFLQSNQPLFMEKIAPIILGITCLILFSVNITSTWAQKTVISRKVTDEKGDPAIVASVVMEKFRLIFMIRSVPSLRDRN